MFADPEIVVGRIETLAVDAVVNAANRMLEPGAGVDGALRRAAGPELTRLTKTLPPLEPSQAIITPGFNAPAKHIIHVAAPIYSIPGDHHDKVFALGACYVNAMTLADGHGLRSIAFPCLGAGNYGWPIELACGVGLTHVYVGLSRATHIARVIMCCFTEADAAHYRKGLRGEL